MSVPTFEEIIREAHRLLGETEEVLRRAWRGEGPTETQIETLDDVRGQIAVTKIALARMARAATQDLREFHDAPPDSLQRPIAPIAPISPLAPIAGAPDTRETVRPPARRARRRASR
ncbi:hypothetical protein LZC95_18695 [Pendulispora brunnea]|uniref:Uncharacterized protein n=1 Tax=Pendulispora brunnea TaxID=2905690 RepID=A0ABZ2KMD9_9BACT